jgi:hypothetical protein
LFSKVERVRITRMPTFYFNLSGRIPFVDHNGASLPSLVDAMQEAIGVARDLARNKRASDVSGDQVVVTDESGQEVFRMPLTSSGLRTHG